MNSDHRNTIERRLLGVAKRGIKDHYDEKTALFNRIRTGEGFSRESSKLLLLHSLISLIGIGRHNAPAGIDFKRSLDRVVECSKAGSWEIRVGALLIWLLAQQKDPRTLDTAALIRKSRVRRAGTMETAWLVTGLSLAYDFTGRAAAGRALRFALDVLYTRFVNESGLFLHRHRDAASWDYRYHIGNFADQIYAVYALTHAAGVLKEEKSLRMAERCAQKLITLQGNMGQWWWHYNAPRGTVLQKYPVYSVHQDAMAPFALEALSRATGSDYTVAAQKGMEWIAGNNELREQMVAPSGNFVKRGIERIKPMKYLCRLFVLPTYFNSDAAPPGSFDHPSLLRVMDWEYSYHLGWLLYAH